MWPSGIEPSLLNWSILKLRILEEDCCGDEGTLRGRPRCKEERLSFIQQEGSAIRKNPTILTLSS
jgi:hypothetical protein